MIQYVPGRNHTTQEIPLCDQVKDREMASASVKVEPKAISSTTTSPTILLLHSNIKKTNSQEYVCGSYKSVWTNVPKFPKPKM